MALRQDTLVAERPEGVVEQPGRLTGQTLRRHALPVAGYVLLTIAVYWDVVIHLSTHVLADASDGASFLWSFWSIPDALLGGHNPFVTRLMFHPEGARTAFHTNAPLLAILSWPLQKAFGLVVAINVIQLMAVILSAVGAYLLVWRVTGNPGAAFVAGAAFAFVPYRFAQTPHVDLEHVQFLPFGILALLDLYDAPTRRRAVTFGAVVGLVFLTSLYYTVFLLIAVTVVMLWRWRETATRLVARRLLQAAVTAVVVGAPLLVAMLDDLRHHTLDPLRGWGGADAYSANLLSWVTPSTFQRIWGLRFSHLNDIATGGERLAFPGFVVLALAVAGALWGRRRRGLWCAMALVFVMLSFGPFLHVGTWTGGAFSYLGLRFSVPMPYFLFHFLPIVNGVRDPGRLSIVGILALDVLAALALARLAEVRPRLGPVAIAIAGLAILVEFYPRWYPTYVASIPKPYAAIAADPGHRAVLEIPLQWRTGFVTYGDTDGDDTLFLYYATRHGRPLVGGMAARYPNRSMARLVEDPLYRQIVALQQNTPASPPQFDAADLRNAGIGYVVYHRDRPRPKAEAYLAGLHLPTLADDGTVIVWKVP